MNSLMSHKNHFVMDTKFFGIKTEHMVKTLYRVRTMYLVIGKTTWYIVVKSKKIGHHIPLYSSFSVNNYVP